MARFDPGRTERLVLIVLYFSFRKERVVGAKEMFLLQLVYPVDDHLFQIVATDLNPMDLPFGLTLPELQEKLKGHRKGESSIVGRYVNPYPE